MGCSKGCLKNRNYSQPTSGRAGLYGPALPLQIFGFWSIRITSDAP